MSRNSLLEAGAKSEGEVTVNIDIEPVFDHYKAMVYMSAYLSKSENGSSQAMKHGVQDAMENKFPIYDQIRSIAHTYSKECSV